MYGIGVMIPLPEGNDKVVPFVFVGPFDSVAWSIASQYKNPEKRLKKLNKIMFKLFKKPDGYTTIDKLMTAPCDAVLMLSGETGFQYLEGRKPLNCSKGSGNEHVLPSIYEDVTLIVYRVWSRRKQWWHEFMCTEEDMLWYKEQFNKRKED